MTDLDSKTTNNIKNSFITNIIAVALQYDKDLGVRMKNTLKRTPPKDPFDLFGIPDKK